MGIALGLLLALEGTMTLPKRRRHPAKPTMWVEPAMPERTPLGPVQSLRRRDLGTWPVAA